MRSHGIKLSGRLDDDQYLNCRSKEPKIELHQDIHNREGPMSPDGHVPRSRNTFAFWLPLRLNDDIKVRKETLDRCFQRAINIEESFRQIEELSVATLALNLQPLRI